MLVNTDARFTCPVSFRHKGLAARLERVFEDLPDEVHRVDVMHWDMRSPADPQMLYRFADCDVILQVASESHVDRSIADPEPFVRNNVDLMLNILDVARYVQPERMLVMSTDEVYGPAYGGHRHTEWETVIPSNPYAASKAAQDALATSYWRTYGLPVMITRTMNLLAPGGQSSEKFVPMVIRKVLAGETVTIHGSPEGESGSRHWIDAREFASAWRWLIDRAPVQMYPTDDRPSMYHIVGEEMSNLALAQTIADRLDRPLNYEMVSFHSTRPGHDLKYALDGSKLADLGWVPRHSLNESIHDIVQWYLKNPDWLEI